jgi:hypothetical protein
MALTIAVPLNTMLADLDETLRTLLKRELTRHGFDGAEIAFDAPAKEWSSSLSMPTVNLFLYDLHEAESRPRLTKWEEQRDEGQTRELRPPLRVDASYAVTAWTRAVEDEHRLLSQVFAILYAYSVLPDDVLAGTLTSSAAQRFPLETRVAQARTDGKADFWTSIGGQYKASVDYVVTLSCEPGTSFERGPEVRTQTLQVRQVEQRRASVVETHRSGGTVRDDKGEPVANAWIALADQGSWAVSDPDGRFRFDRLLSGTYDCVARAPDGREARAALTVPGAGIDLTIKTPGRAAPKRKR